LSHKIQHPEMERLGKKKITDLTDGEHEKLRQMMINQKVLGLSLSSGGHLTHGFRGNISSKMMQSFEYDVDPKTGEIDYVALEKRAKQVRPLILIAGYSAYPRRLNFARFKEIASSVGAVLLVDMAHFAGLVAGGVFQGEYNPIPYADVVTTTTHKTLRGPRGGLVLCRREYAPAVDRGCPMVLGGPLPHVMAAKAVAFEEALSPSFRIYARQVVSNCQVLAEEMQSKVGGVLTKGSDNHLLVCDVMSAFSLTGRQAEAALHRAHLTVNRNLIPEDPLGAWFTSGVRMGTAALTTLGMDETCMKEVASIIIDLLRKTKPLPKGNLPLTQTQVDISPEDLLQAQTRVADLLRSYPLYQEIPDIEMVRSSQAGSSCGAASR
jgi:glycine hydroxymethyltransferase